MSGQISWSTLSHPTGSPGAEGGAEERKVNPKQSDLALAAADAAARRLLVRVIDLRLDLEDAGELIQADQLLSPGDLSALRTDAEAVRREVERLCSALEPSGAGAAVEGEGESEEASRALSRSRFQGASGADPGALY